MANVIVDIDVVITPAGGDCGPNQGHGPGHGPQAPVSKPITSDPPPPPPGGRRTGLDQPGSRHVGPPLLTPPAGRPFNPPWVTPPRPHGSRPDLGGHYPGRGPELGGRYPGRGPEFGGRYPGRGPGLGGHKPGRGPELGGHYPGRGPGLAGKRGAGGWAGTIPGAAPALADTSRRGPELGGHKPGRGPELGGHKPGRGPEFGSRGSSHRPIAGIRGPGSCPTARRCRRGRRPRSRLRGSRRPVSPVRGFRPRAAPGPMADRPRCAEVRRSRTAVVPSPLARLGRERQGSARTGMTRPSSSSRASGVSRATRTVFRKGCRFRMTIPGLRVAKPGMTKHEGAIAWPALAVAFDRALRGSLVAHSPLAKPVPTSAENGSLCAFSVRKTGSHFCGEWLCRDAFSVRKTGSHFCGECFRVRPPRRP